MKRVKGVPLAEGIAKGKLLKLITALPVNSKKTTTVSKKQIVHEIARVRHAIQLVSLVIDHSIEQVEKHIGKDYVEFFTSLKELLHDKMLLVQMTELIEQNRYNAKAAVKETLEAYKELLNSSVNPYFRDRVSDIVEIEESLLEALTQPDLLISERKDITHDYILFSAHLTPRLVLEAKRNQFKGIIAEQGGVTSHAAILCRATGIPAVAGIKVNFKRQTEHGYVALNGTTGDVLFSSSKKEIRNFSEPKKRDESKDITEEKRQQMVIMANIGLSENAIEALAAGAEGIGLYRTEVEFIAAGRLLTEYEQFVRYRNTVIAMMGMPVTFRLLDVSADKFAAIFKYFGGNIDKELRGSAFLLAWPEMLETQARAITKVAPFGNVKVMYPLVTSFKQFWELKQIFYSTVEKESSVLIEHGTMFEHPDACMEAEEILREADFGSIGTNDLLQSFTAIDREYSGMDAAEKSNNKMMWEAIEHVASVAQKYKKPLTVCGELGADPKYISRFLELGISTFSMEPRKIRRLKRKMELK